MKIKLIYSILLVLFLICFQAGFAQGPPNPPGDPSLGGGPIGGSAPLGGGTEMLLLLAVGYGLKKTLKFPNKKEKAAQELD
jgi:hypothetical protein